MGKYKKRILHLLLVIFALVFCFVIFKYNKNISQLKGINEFDFYFINQSSNKIEVEKREINFNENKNLIFSNVISEYFQGSKNSKASLMLPRELKLKEASFDGNVAHIDLEKSFDEISPESRILSIGSLVYTLTELDFIDSVIIYVDSEPIKNRYTGEVEVFNRSVVLNNPTVEPEKTNWEVVKLYFSDSEGKSLVCQQRSVEVKQSLSLEYQIVEQLIFGPDSSENHDLLGTMPLDTKIRDIKTEEGICYVNLSKEFLRTRASINENVTIYSIVNSLTELENVNKVQFLIEGEKINEYSKGIDFSKPFDRNEKIISKSQE